MILSKYSKQIVTYLISGSIAAFVNLSLLYIFTELLHFWYVISASIAYVSAFGISFTLQKFWTFKDHKIEGIHKQLSLYFLVMLINIILNALFVYLFVEYAEIWYMLAQVISGLIIAIESFFVYKLLIFRRSYLLSLNTETVNNDMEAI